MALHILGTGLNCKQHLTPETILVLKKCKVIYTLLPDEDLIKHIASLCPISKIIDCYSFYANENNRPKIYEKIADQIIKDAKVRKWSDIAFLSYGHPLFLVSATEKMIIKANEEGLKTKVYPAISSLDSIICDLKLEIGYCFSVYDASLIIKEEININIEIPNFIFQVANLNDSSIQRGEISYKKLMPLISFLSQKYGQAHEIILIVSSQDIFTPPIITKIKIGDLHKCKSPKLKDRPTMYIPPKHY